MGSFDIELLPVQVEHRAALLQGKDALRGVRQLHLPAEWPQFPEAFSMDVVLNEQWPSYFFVDRRAGILVGNGGFAGPPREEAEVEIGYEVAPEFQNRGYATSAVRSLLAIAFSRPKVEAVIAHTLAEENASNAVLRKLGTSLVAEIPNPEVGSVWKWRLPRAP